MVRPLVVSVALFAVACALASVSARVAVAAVPSPPFSTFDNVIVGSTSTIPIAGGACAPTPGGFRVVVRDINNAPIAGSNVALNFSATTIRLLQTQTAGTTVNCATRTLHRITNASGLTTFIPMFGGFENANRVEIAADGVVLGLVPARSTDVDAVDGQTGLNDFTLFSAAFNGLIPKAELNFDNCPPGASVPTLSDFTILNAQFQSAAVGTYCP